MRLVARLIIGTALVLILTGAALFLLRKPLAGAAAEQLLARARLESPAVAVSDVSFSRLALDSVKAGANASAPEVSLTNVVLGFDWRDLIFRGRLKSISIDGGRVVAELNEKGAFSIAGWTPDENAKPAPPPFAALSIDALDVIANTPKGPARVHIGGDFDLSSGGKFDIALAADEAGFAAASISSASGKGSIELAPDGAITGTGAITGDIATPAGVARGVDAAIAAALSSWRGAFGDGPRMLTGDARVSIASSTIDATASPALASINAAGGAPIDEMSLAGIFKATFAEGGVSVSLADDALTIIADRGDRLTISGGEGPLYESRNGNRRLSLTAALEGPIANGALSVSASSENGGPWNFETAAKFSEQAIGPVALAAFDGNLRGEYFESRARGKADVVAYLKKVEIGRLIVADMPASARLDVEIDLAGRRFTASPANGECLKTDRASLRHADQDMDAHVSNAVLCPGSDPLILIGWGENAFSHVEGALNAKAAHYRLGRTVFDGAPPRIDFNLDYAPATQTTRIAGAIAGGRVLLNRAFVLSRAEGDFEAEMAPAAAGAKITLASMRVAQNAELEKVAPVVVSGDARLANEIATFDFSVKTPKGAPLGRGEGSHQVKSGRGEAVFDSGLLTFAHAMQPDSLIPALRGVISKATGVTEGRARFAWAPNEVVSSATINLDNVSFGGPGVAVTRTEGVTGKIVFSNLSPVATAGEQSISISKIDLDALKLENGFVRFSLPGDDTLKIVEAEFPWFEGTIGAYGSQMSIAEGKSETSLQIDNVNLGELLSFIKVEGLSGVGVVEGVLPISFEGARARVNNGILSSKGPGIVRYQGKAAVAASQSNEQSALAFEILRELRFDKLSAIIDGPLDGTLKFKILFEGRSDIPVKTGKKTQRVDSPVKYRINIEAPLLSLIEQAVLSTDVKLQIERAQKEEAARNEAQ